MTQRSVVLLSGFSPSLVGFRGPLIRELSSSGYRVIGCGPPDASAAASLAEIGADFMPIGPMRTSLNPLTDLAYFWDVMRYLLTAKPHAVIAYTAKPVIWGILAAWVARVPVRVAMITGLGYVFEEEGPGRGGWARRVGRQLYRVALSRVTTTIFQNTDDQLQFEQTGMVPAGSSHVVNGSGVELDHFVSAPLPSNGSFLLIARLLVTKGIREYAQAAEKLRSRYPGATFSLAGWFDENPASIAPCEVEQWVSKGTIRYLGSLDDVRPAIANADVYVLPSYREGLPRTVLEAMAMGRPIITSDVPGCRQAVVQGINGLLVPARDPDSLAAAMQRFLDEPALSYRMGLESRRLAEERYDASIVARAVMNAAQL